MLNVNDLMQHNGFVGIVRRIDGKWLYAQAVSIVTLRPLRRKWCRFPISECRPVYIEPM